ncbi:MAG: hypothetical protein HUU41_03595 [Bryobacteraceae bacterium]|nr:hypothetical protein [Bryobacterales bacterium]MEB2362851.1 hypothetical protein [Bryobacterales bacterium]NUN00174.1 hypothetical protein [Bryobacteraceae bacterium]
MAQARGLRALIRWTWVVAVVALLYTASVFVLRWRHNRAAVEAIERSRAEADRKIVEQYGADELKILTFYASPGLLKRGDTGLLCYGVLNAKSVRIEPGVEEIHPALSRCVEVKPGATTTYTLSAADDSGKAVSQTVEVRVQ